MRVPSRSAAIAFSAVLAFHDGVPDESAARRTLPIELSSIVTSLETLTRELTRKLSDEERTEVVSALCERLRALPGEQRGPNRPFTG